VAAIVARMRKMGVVFAGMPGMLGYKDEVQTATLSGAVFGGDYRHGRDVFCAKESGTPPTSGISSTEG
jgi:hypothetical protein